MPKLLALYPWKFLELKKYFGIPLRFQVLWKVEEAPLKFNVGPLMITHIESYEAKSENYPLAFASLCVNEDKKDEK